MVRLTLFMRSDYQRIESCMRWHVVECDSKRTYTASLSLSKSYIFF